MNNLLFQDISNNAYSNQEHYLNNLLTFSNNYMHFLNSSTYNLNSLISTIINTNYQQVPYQQVPYQQVPYQQVPYQQVPYQQNQNAYLLDYKLEDFEKLSNTNVYAIIKTATEKVFYGNIENPNNDSCSITQEIFSIYDNVTRIKECNHIFNSNAIEKWLIRHQTCPNCRYNILSNTNIISYINPENNKQIFLYNNEFKFYLALYIESLLTNRGSLNDAVNNSSPNNSSTNNTSPNNIYEFGVFLR
jgi:hypothetical protein